MHTPPCLPPYHACLRGGAWQLHLNGWMDRFPIIFFWSRKCRMLGEVFLLLGFYFSGIQKEMLGIPSCVQVRWTTMAQRCCGSWGQAGLSFVGYAGRSEGSLPGPTCPLLLWGTQTCDSWASPSPILGHSLPAEKVGAKPALLSTQHLKPMSYDPWSSPGTEDTFSTPSLPSL